MGHIFIEVDADVSVRLMLFLGAIFAGLAALGTLYGTAHWRGGEKKIIEGNANTRGWNKAQQDRADAKNGDTAKDEAWQANMSRKDAEKWAN